MLTADMRRLFDDWLERVSTNRVDRVDGDEAGRVLRDMQLLRAFFDQCEREYLYRYDQSGVWAAEGARSSPSALASETNAPRSRLAMQLRIATRLRQLPAAGEAASVGLLNSDHCRALADLVGPVEAGVLAEGEAMLVEQGAALRPEDFAVVCRRFRDLAEAAAATDDGAESESPPPEPGSRSVGKLHLSETLDGWWVLDGRLPPEEGALLAAALDAVVDRRLRARRGGDPTDIGLAASAIRAEAIVDLVANRMRREPGEKSVPDRYRVGILVTPEQLAHAPCDATFYRIIVDADSEVLDVGREDRRWPEPIRRAITIRDRGCVFPGCDRPPNWCDIHHMAHWGRDHGETKLDNGALLCRHHHTFIHTTNWTMRLENGKPAVFKPDGTRHEIVLHRLQTAASVASRDR